MSMQWRHILHTSTGKKQTAYDSILKINNVYGSSLWPKYLLFQRTMESFEFIVAQSLWLLPVNLHSHQIMI